MAKKSSGPRLLITSDIHVTDRPQDEYRWNIFSKMFETLDRCDYWCILGDIAEAKDRHSAWLVNRVIGWVSQMASVKPGFVLMGNHDYIDPKDSFWKMLGEIKGVTFVDESSFMAPVMISVTEGHGLICFTPHCRTQEEWDFKYQMVPVEKPLVHFCHQTFTGAKSDGDNHTLTGIAPPKTKTQIITGDVHRPQTLGNITYVGAPHPVDFGDDYEPRMLLWSPETTESIPLKTIRKLNIKVGPKNDLLPLRKGDRVRITVEMSRADACRWEEIKRKFGCQVVMADAIVDSIEPIIRLGKTEAAQEAGNGPSRLSADPKDVLTVFGEARAVEADLMKAGKALLAEIKT